MSGWQLVPVEPTPEMEYAWDNGKTSTYRRFREKWRNALAAAPAPEVDELRKELRNVVISWKSGVMDATTAMVEISAALDKV